MGLRGWRILAENHWRTFGENAWRSVGENTWRTLGENLWRIIARKLTAFAGIGLAGRFELEFAGSNGSSHAHRFLGSPTETYPGALSAHLDRQAISQSCPAFRANSQKEF